MSSYFEYTIKNVLKIIRAKSSGTVAIFSPKQDLYAFFGEDALLVANEVFMSDTSLRTLRTDNADVTYLIISGAQFSRVVRDLLVFLRYRVELYEDVCGSFNLKSKGTLGNLADFEDVVSEYVDLAELSSVILVRLTENDQFNEGNVHLVFCNSLESRVVTAEFFDTPCFTLLESCVVTLQPRECLLLQSDSIDFSDRFKKLESAIRRANLVTKYLTGLDYESLFIQENFKSKVYKMLNGKFSNTNFNDFDAKGILTVLQYMNLLESRFEGAFSFFRFDSSGYMYLSNSALQALEVFSPDSDSNHSIVGTLTLFDHLNKCRSNPGRKILREWVRRPLFDRRQIEERLDVVEALTLNHSVRQSLHEFLRSVPDLLLIVRKFNQNTASLMDCYRIYQLCLLLRSLQGVIDELKYESGERWTSIRELISEPIQHSILEFKKFVELINRTIDEEYYSEYKQLRIKPDIDEQLFEIANEMKEAEAKANKQLDIISTRLGLENIKVESNSEFGFYFRVTLKSDKFLRDNSEVKVIDVTKGGGIRFQTKELIIINQQFLVLQAEYEKGQSELTKLVLKTCAGYSQASRTLSENIGILDVLTSFSVIASNSPGPCVRPKILEPGSGVFELVGCRHPIIENLSDLEYIPNDVKFEDDSRFILLTGANMGGKSTYLRSAALTILMAQIGSFVPCSSATFSMIDGIYTRVGAGDFQYKGVSTFMAEMIDCATILERATKNSLIIVDELGRGTSTYDGFGIARAIAENIISKIGCFCLFATHFHELSSLQQDYSKEVRNYNMETIVDEKTGGLTILYQIKSGISDRSFGLNIAKIVGFSNEIIQDAEKILNDFEKSYNKENEII